MYDLIPSENTVDKLIVHGGLMHADDILCAAISKMINENVQIDRVFKVPDESELAKGILVADIGRGAFDHHQPDVKAQPNGHKHASIGFVLENDDIRAALKEKGFDLDDPKYKNFFKEIGQIEDLDNGLVGTQSHAISDFCAYMNPVWDSKETPNDRFATAVDMVQHRFVEPCLEHGFWPEKDQQIMQDYFKGLEKESLAAEKRAEDVVLPALDKMENNIVVLPQFAPWDKQLVPSEAELVIYPSNRGGFNLQCVPPELGSFEKKVELPDWSQNMPKGCTFEHPGKFLANFETLEDAKNAAKQIILEKEQIREQPVEEQNLSKESQMYDKIQDELTGAIQKYAKIAYEEATNLLSYSPAEQVNMKHEKDQALDAIYNIGQKLAVDPELYYDDMPEHTSQVIAAQEVVNGAIKASSNLLDKMPDDARKDVKHQIMQALGYEDQPAPSKNRDAVTID